MKNQFFFLAGVVTLLFSGCAKIYNSPDAASRAGSHRIIAIAPPSVSIAAQKKVDAEAIKEQQKTESVNFQKEMHAWFLRRKMQNKMNVEVLDIETTNAKLQRAGHYDGNPLSPAEMCEALGVDGLVTSNYSLTKPMSEGGAIAVGLIFGVWGSTNEVTGTISIHDKSTSKMIWNFNHKLSGGTFSTPAQVVDGLMRQASRKMPYTM